MLKSLKFYFLALLVAPALFISCDDDEPDADDLNIVETAQATNDLSTLVSALQEANLVSTLEAEGPFTVFAPNNDAFQALLDGVATWNDLTDIDDGLLDNVLKFHVLAAEVESGDLENSYVTTLATGPNGEQIVLQIDVNGGVTLNGSASPLTTDIETDNGIVHIIDEVMLPPTVVDIATSNSNFSTLVAALTRDDLQTDFISILNNSTPNTVFAPTNAAFQALLDSNGEWNSLGDIPRETLEAVLSYHVLNGANVQSDELTDGQSIVTVGGTLTVDLSSGAKLTTSSGQSVSIVIPNVQGVNGVVHAIDEVLLP